MNLRPLREQLGALLAGLLYRAAKLRLRPTLTELAVLALFLIILGLAGAADQAHP